MQVNPISSGHPCRPPSHHQLTTTSSCPCPPLYHAPSFNSQTPIHSPTAETTTSQAALTTTVPSLPHRALPNPKPTNKPAAIYSIPQSTTVPHLLHNLTEHITMSPASILSAVHLLSTKINPHHHNQHKRQFTASPNSNEPAPLPSSQPQSPINFTFNYQNQLTQSVDPPCRAQSTQSIHHHQTTVAAVFKSTITSKNQTQLSAQTHLLVPSHAEPMPPRFLVKITVHGIIGITSLQKPRRSHHNHRRRASKLPCSSLMRSLQPHAGAAENKRGGNQMRHEEKQKEEKIK